MLLIIYRRIISAQFRCRISTFVIIIFIATLVSLYFLRSSLEALFVEDLRPIIFSRALVTEMPELQPRPVRILFWTTLYTSFNQWEWWFKQQYLQEGCPQLNCTFTTNRSTIATSDAVVFHGFHVDLNASDIPTFRDPRQRWIYLMGESPHLPVQDISGFNGLFNWTMTFRNDSDLFFNYDSITTVPDTNFTKHGVKNYALGKTKLIGWMVSHCITKGHREDFVSELKKYVPVDIIGLCGNLRCQGRNSDKCYRMIATTYKFYLSFENNICPEYITEKFFAYLSYDIVPVVFGGPGYDAYLPKEAYIDALSFASPRELALYLQLLDKDDNLYNKFFEWKRGLTVQHHKKHRWNCELCQKVGDSSLPAKWYDDINYWWNKKRQCRYWKDGKTYVHGTKIATFI